MKNSWILFALWSLMPFSPVFAQNNIREFRQLGAMASLQNVMYFTADDGISGMELWSSDGTREGTFLIKDIYPGYNGSTPANIRVYNNELYFTANDGLHGNELWKTDGTAEGTKMIKNLRPDDDPYETGSSPHNLVVFKGMLYFAAADTLFGGNLWKTDGTPEGFTRVYCSDYWTITELTATDTRLYFVRRSGPRELWQSDGTAEGTQLLPVDDFYTMTALFSFNGFLYLATQTTYNETVRLYNLVPGESEFNLLKEFKGWDQEYGNFTGVNNEIFFSITAEAPSDHYKDELWKTNGTADGTALVKSFDWDRYISESQIGSFISFNGFLYFNGGNTNDYSFWKSDGTSLGTKEVKQVSLYNQNNMVKTANGMYFSSGDQLWFSDGSAEGTKIYTEIDGAGYDGILPVKNLNDMIFFETRSETGYILWNTTPKPLISVKAGWSEILSGGTVNFPDTEIDALSTINLVISNNGLQELFISGIELTGGSYLTELESCMIGPGNSRTFKINFFPGTMGLKSESLTIYSNDNKASRFPVYLKGIAKEAASPNTLTINTIDLPDSSRTSPVADTLMLSGKVVTGDADPGITTGYFSVKGGNEGYNFSLVSGTGDADNNKFIIIDSTLVTAVKFNYDYQSTHVIRVRAENSLGSQIERYFTIEVKKAPEEVTLVCGKTLYDLGYSLNDVCYHKDDIFAVGDQGIIIRSSDDGSTWELINSGTQRSLQDIQFVSDHTAYILAGDLLLKTEDSGANWFPVSAFPASAMHFISENEGYLAGSSGIIYKTQDGGKTWVRSATGYSDAQSIYFVNSDKGFICGRYNMAGMTEDGGKTWARINMENIGWNEWFMDVFFTDEVHGYILCENGKVLFSEDGGKTWIQKSQVGMEYGENIQFVNSTTGYISGGWLWGNVYKTIDGGVTWQSMFSTLGSPSGLGIHSDGTRLCVVGDAAGYGSTSNSGHFIWQSVNSGESWINLSNLAGDADYYNVRFFEDGTGYLFGGIYNGNGLAYKTTDNGITWKSLPISASWNIRKCHFMNRDTIIAIADSVYITKNGGLSWNTMPGFETWRQYSFVNPDTVYAISNTEVYKTTDGGQTWPLKQSGDEWYFNINFRDGKLGVASGLYKIVSTADGGATWTTFTHNLGKLFKAVCYLGKDTILIGGGDGTVLKSTDGGLSWTKIRTIIPVEIIEIQFIDARKGYALASNGGGWSKVFLTNDAGETWTDLFGTGDEANAMYLSKKEELFIAGGRGTFFKYAASMPPAAAGNIIGKDTYCPGELINLQTPSIYNAWLRWSIEGDGTLSYSGNQAVVKPGGTGDITVKVVPDNGCGTGIPGQITVKKAEPVDFSILGKDTVNQLEKDVIYMPDNGGLRNLWHVEGNRYVTADIPGQINVDWGNGTSGKIELIQTSDEGCRKKASKSVTILVSTSITKPSDEIQVTVYPNPASELLNLELPGSEQVFYELSLIDETGKLCGHYRMEGSSHTIDVSGIPRGNYILLIKNQQHSARVKITLL